MLKLDTYLKIAEAARFLGVSQNTLRKWSDECRIRVHVNPANSYRLFRQSDLAAFLKQTARVAPGRRKAK